MIELTEKQAKRFWSHVVKTDECWLWTAGCNTYGYGRFRVGDKVCFVHHITTGGPPAGLVSDHLCRTRNCVRPDHIEFVTRGENVLRGVGPTATNARKTQCKRGHDLTTGNLRSVGNKRTQRMCAECDRQRKRRYYAEGRR